MKYKTFNLPVVQCEGCRKKLDAAAPLDKKGGPQPGVFTVCVYCGNIMRFDAGLRLRTATPAEMLALEIEAPETYYLMQKAIALIKERVRQN
jgi:hypothetical protein